MANPDQKPPSNRSPLQIYEHVASLHFCCPGLFLLLHPREQNTLIALRFGCSDRVVRKWRALPWKCERSKSCLLPRCASQLTRDQITALTEDPPPAAEPSGPSDPPTPTEGIEKS